MQTRSTSYFQPIWYNITYILCEALNLLLNTVYYAYSALSFSEHFDYSESWIVDRENIETVDTKSGSSDAFLTFNKKITKYKHFQNTEIKIIIE